jgi:hypothetical protein
MDFRLPTSEQLHAGLRALKTVAESDGPLNAGEAALLTAAQHAFGGQFDLDALDPITPEALAGLVQDRQIRWQLTGGLIVMTMADGDVEDAEVGVVEAFASALDVDELAVRNLRRVADGHRRTARLSILRHQWAPRKLKQLAARDGKGVYWKALLALLNRNRDPALAARYEALADCPPGSLGRGYYDFITQNGISFPGQPGSPPEVIVFHDMTHVLAGYGTTPSDEILAAAFSAGYSHHDHLNWLMFVLLQFQLGIQTAPGVEPEYDMLEPARLIAAVRRGAAMKIDLNAAWEYWPVINEPLDTLRARYNILPESAFLHT